MFKAFGVPCKVKNF